MNTETLNDGESVIALYLKRTEEGLQVNVQTAVAVEEFFKHWGGAQRRNVGTVGRLWKSNLQGGLVAWELSRLDDHTSFTLVQLGTDITRIGEAGPNLSFLRLVGVSEPGGVTFTVDSVISRGGLEKLAHQLNLACGRFYDEYIKPAEVDITVSVKPRF